MFTLTSGSRITAAQISRTFELPGDGKHALRLAKGQVWVDDVLIPEARFGNSFVGWSHDTPELRTSGLMYFDETGDSRFAILPEKVESVPRPTPAIATEPASASYADVATNAIPPSTDCTLVELLTLVPNHDVVVLSQQMIQQNMKWALTRTTAGNNWLENIMGEKAPTMFQEQQDIAEKALGWYQNVLARSVLTNALQTYTGEGAPTRRLSDNEALWVKNFLEPSTEDTLKAFPVIATSPAYAEQNKDMYMYAFRSHVKRLGAYIADHTTDWAKALNDWLDGDMDRLVDDMVQRVGNSDAMLVVNNYTTLLAALDPSEKRAAEFHKKVLDNFRTRIVGALASQVDSIDSAALGQWLPDVLQTLFESIANGVIKFQGISAEEAKIGLDELATKGAEICSAFGAIYEAMQVSDILKNTPKYQEYFASNFLAKYPKLSFFGNTAIFVSGVFSLISVIGLLARVPWKDLSERERTEAVTQIVAAFVTAPTLWEAGGNVTKLGNWLFDYCRSEPSSSLGETFRELTTAEQNGEVTAFNPATAPEDPELFQGFKSIFKEGKAVGMFKLAGLALTWLAVGLSAWKVADDVNNDESAARIGVDSAALAAGILTAIFATADLIFAVAWLPFLSIGFAVAGLLFAFIEALLPHESPLDEFMRRTGESFARGLSESGSTFPIHHTAPLSGDTNSVDFTAHTPSMIEIRYSPGYGIVNIRFSAGDAGATTVIAPATSYDDGDGTGGWLTPDHSGDIEATTPGAIDGIWFTRDQQGSWDYGIVNLSVHRSGMGCWDSWLSPASDDSTATDTSEPRVVGKILSLTTLREARHGIIDAVFAYDSRTE